MLQVSRKIAAEISSANLFHYYGRRGHRCCKHFTAQWLATCARKLKVPGSSPAAMCRGELSASIARLMSKCL